MSIGFLGERCEIDKARTRTRFSVPAKIHFQILSACVAVYDSLYNLVLHPLGDACQLVSVYSVMVCYMSGVK